VASIKYNFMPNIALNQGFAAGQRKIQMLNQNVCYTSWRFIAELSLIPWLAPMWKYIRYSRIYSNISNNWFSMQSLFLRPPRLFFWISTSFSIVAKFSNVSYFTPIKRPNSSASGLFTRIYFILYYHMY
jgi:hypothetical protein